MAGAGRQFIWAGHKLSVRQFVDRFGKKLPQLLLIQEGFFGPDQDFHQYSTDEIYWVFDVQCQKRAMFNDQFDRYIHVPLDHNARMYAKHPGSDPSQPLTIVEVAKECRGFQDKAMFCDEQHIDLSCLDEDDEDAQELGNLGYLEFEGVFEQRYLLAYSFCEGDNGLDCVDSELRLLPAYLPLVVDVAVGLQGDDLTAFFKVITKLTAAYELSTPRFNQGMVLQRERPDDSYEYVEPFAVPVSKHIYSDHPPAPLTTSAPLDTTGTHRYCTRPPAPLPVAIAPVTTDDTSGHKYPDQPPAPLPVAIAPVTTDDPSGHKYPDRPPAPLPVAIAPVTTDDTSGHKYHDRPPAPLPVAIAPVTTDDTSGHKYHDRPPAPLPVAIALVTTDETSGHKYSDRPPAPLPVAIAPVTTDDTSGHKYSDLPPAPLPVATAPVTTDSCQQDSDDDDDYLEPVITQLYANVPPSSAVQIQDPKLAHKAPDSDIQQKDSYVCMNTLQQKKQETEMSSHEVRKDKQTGIAGVLGTHPHKTPPPVKPKPSVRQKQIENKVVGGCTGRAGTINICSGSLISCTRVEARESVELSKEGKPILSSSQHTTVTPLCQTKVAKVSPMVKTPHKLQGTAMGSDENKQDKIKKHTSMWQSMNDIPQDTSILSVEEVETAVGLLGLDHRAAILAVNHVDGALLASLTKKILIEDFKFNEFEAQKLEMFIKGWRPKE